MQNPSRYDTASKAEGFVAPESPDPGPVDGLVERLEAVPGNMEFVCKVAKDDEIAIISMKTFRLFAEAAAALKAQAALVAELEAANADAKEQWLAGYLIAVSTMLHQHGEDTIAEDALNEANLKLSDAKRVGLTEFDLKLLAPIFANMRRKSRPQGAPR